MREDSKRLQEIPEIFHSYENNGPFTHCIECERNLLEDTCDYVIEKAVRNYPGYEAKDVIFDYAICMECAQEVQKGISRESLKQIQQYLQNNINPQLQQSRLAASQNDMNGLIKNCMVNNTSMDDCEEYQLFAFCRGRNINFEMPPYMISGKVLNEISELLSNKTRDELNGIFEKHFSPSPFFHAPDPRLILI